MMDITQRLKEIKERCEAATEGPWESKYQNWSMLISHNKFETYLASTKERNNADFIAHARTDVPMLLEMLDECLKERYGVFKKTLIPNLEKIAEKYK